MPELPEVETVVRALKKVFVKNSIASIKYFRKTLRYPIPQQKIKKILLQEKNIIVSRRAKYILLQTSHGVVLVHLGMSGQLVLVSKKSPLLPHTHIVLTLREEGKESPYELRYIDPRRFGLFDAILGFNWDDHFLLRHLGMEPLKTKDLGENLWNISRKKKVSVKSFIMNQKNLVGVGNIYACEALFLAGVSPFRIVNTVSRQKFNLIAHSICDVLKKAIRRGGTTLKDYRTLSNQEGYFSINLKVYGMDDSACEVCQKPIKKIQQNMRSTWWCSRCQK